MKTEVWVGVDAIAHDGTARRVVDRKSDSFVQNFMKAMACSFDGSALLPVIDTGGVERNINFSGTFPTGALATQDHFGLQVGTNDTVTTGNEYALGSQVANGNGTGFLVHGPMSFSSTQAGPTTIEFSMGRSFINLSTEPITIREIGLVSRISGYNILMIRDVVNPIVVPVNDGINASMTLRTVL